MKVTVSLLSAAVVVAAAQPHRHGHQHAHEKREAQGPQGGQDWQWSQTMDIVAGPTVTVYMLNGQPISEADVMQGIKNGTLVWANGGVAEASTVVSSSSEYVAPTSSSSPVSIATTSSLAPAYTPQSTPASSSASSEAPSSSSAPASSAPPAPAYSSPAPSPSSSTSDSATGVDSAFPDGQLDCSTFPSQYGAVAVDWMGLGGWTGVQNPGSDNGGFSNILTVTSNTCGEGGNCCSEGSFCSYACPAGYQKSQWPSTQGATGQSVGGIQCQGGKLHLTNPGMSKNLCMTGASQVTVLVENNLSKNVPICRTDYPGTEAETVPLDAEPGTTSNLTCPDASNYYNWEGGHTSAQYYVNPEGTSVQDACQWGSSANPWGNYAPLNLGVGYSNGAAWLSIFQNAPTTTASLDFTVEITGDGLSGTCKYSNGQYCSGVNYDSCSATTGCTVSTT